MPPIPPPRAQGFTTTTPVPLYWVEYGDPGAPPLLLLHGGPGASHDYLLPQMLELAEEHGSSPTTSAAADGRATTTTAPSSAGATRWRTSARVAAELRVSPLTIVGYSWGGLLAMLYAVEASAGAVQPAAGASRAHRPRARSRGRARAGVRAGVRAPAGGPGGRRAARRAAGERPARARSRRLPAARVRAQRRRLLRRPGARARPHAVPRHRPRPAVHLGNPRRLRPARRARVASACRRWSYTAGRTRSRSRRPRRRRVPSARRCVVIDGLRARAIRRAAGAALPLLRAFLRDNRTLHSAVT